jgi:hypothetical protein
MEIEEINLINNPQGVNANLISKNLSLKELETYLRLRFEDYKQAGSVASLSECRVRQILIGYKLPKSPFLIRRIASAWGIDEIKLTQLFEEERC